MSTLTVQPLSGGLNPAHRDAQTPVSHTVAGIPQTARTQMAGAVQQLRATDKAAQMTLKPVAPPATKRGELVGPPPSFEVNVLQHLRENRDTPPDNMPDTAQAPETTPSPQPNSQQIPQGYAELADIPTAQSGTDAPDHVDLVL